MYKYLYGVIVIFLVYYIGYWQGSNSVKIAAQSQSSIVSEETKLVQEIIVEKPMKKSPAMKSNVQEMLSVRKQKNDSINNSLSTQGQKIADAVSGENSLSKEMPNWKDHPGRVEELEAGIRYENGEVVG